MYHNVSGACREESMRMPLTLRDKASLLTVIIDSLLAGGIITDVSEISVMRQLAEGVAADLADLSYDDWRLTQMFYLATASDEDLDARGQDWGLSRTLGQAASGTVLFTRDQAWVDDIALPAPQVLQATLAEGTALLYRSLGDTALRPQGRSVSGQAPSSSVVSGVTDQLQLNLDGDGVRTLTLGTQTTAAALAATLQTLVRALTALTPGNQPAYTLFRCDYDLTTPGAYTLRSGTTGLLSSVVVTSGALHDGTHALKLGVAEGGRETPGEDNLPVPVLCDQLGVIGNVGAGQIRTQTAPVAGLLRVGNAIAFANGREPESDDAYRQSLQVYRLALGVGTQDSVEQAVLHAVTPSDGQQHVMTAQVAHGAGLVQAWVCDGQSLTVGAQAETVQAVQDELEGRGARVGGWLPVGVQAAVAPASVFVVDVHVRIKVGPTPNKVLAQQAITSALYDLLFFWPVGVLMSRWQMDSRIDQTVAEMLGVDYVTPVQYTRNPADDLAGTLGEKFMPGALVVEVVSG
jgi:uncharacterized phage protein gp47/JayE